MQKDRYYQIYLKEELAARLQKNPHYSLRSFARALQIDPTALSKIINGKKIPTPSLSEKILSQLLLSGNDQKRFLLSMAQAYESEGVQRKRPEIKAILKRPHTRFPKRDLAPDLFRIISDWYHFAILQLVNAEGFIADTKWIARQLNLQEIEVKLAVERLINLELLVIEGGQWKRVSESVTAGDPAVTSSAHRKRMKQITEKSLYSLENDPIEERNHSATTMAIDPDKLPIAKARIQKFMNQLADELQTKKKRVYELQVNLFPLQRNEK